MPVTELVPENSIEPIAVVGMSVRVPGAETLEQFWANLRDGVESIRFFSDEELLAAGVSAEDLANPDYVKACGALRDVESFDADFFSFTPREAETLDPQHRIFLECAWRALEHAGCDPQRYDGRIAVYGGVGLNGYLIHNLLGHRDLLATLGGWQLSLGNDKDFAVSRVSYKLNLQGPSIAVNTACSTSLVATAMGCQSLLNYQCDMVLAGGCSVHLPQDRGYFYHHGGTLSPDGHCRPFEAHAAGTIDGNGAAIVALKRLEDALVDGDEVYGVIRGFAVNNDGDLKVGYTAPSVEGQAEVIREAQEMAGISAADIHYVETHGTGTDLGDPVEMAALVEAFRASTANKGYCAIGSVKSNIGHLDTAAGTASLIKTLLAIRHGQIPPLLHFEAPNPKIDFARSPFYINGELIEWPRAGDAPRRAGVSSFGIGGTNAHIVVEEAPARSPSVAARDWQLLTLSAKSATALDQLSLDLADYVQENPQESMADIAHTLQVGRREFVHRRSVLVGDAGDAIENLRDLGAVRTYANVAASDPPVVFLFSGQDAQYIHMAAGLRGESAFANALAECSALLAEHGINLEELIWPGGGVGAPQFDAEFALDPVPLLAIEYALARLWQSWGVEPSAMLGYSLGEYVVAVLAGVLSLGDALGLAAAGRELLRATEPGALLGVALGAGEVQNELGATLYLAMVNGPRQCVVGGAPDAVEALHQRLLKRGVSAQPLPIARAFHTPMMQPLVDAFRQHLERVELQPPTLPYISCLTGDWISDAEATDPEHYLALATGTVQLDAALETLLADAICGEAGATLLEVSPAQTLSSLAAQHPRRPESVEIFSSLRDPRYQVSGAVGREKNGDQPTLLATLGRVWARGVAVDWSAFHLEQGRRRLALPGHPFQRQRYWVEPAPQGAEPTLVAAEQGKSAAVERWFYAPGWRRCPRPYSTATDAPIDWLVFADAGGVAEALAFRLETQGHRVVLVRSGSDFAEREDGFVLDLNSPEQLDRLLSELNASGRAPARIAHMALLGLSTEENQLLEQSFYGLLYLGRALGQHCFDSEVDLILLSDGLLAVGDAPALRPGKAVALGPLRVIPQEYPNIHTRALDIVPASEGRGRDALLCAMLAEFSAECTEPAVALRGNNRWVEHFDPLPLSAPADTPRRLRLQGTYLITGGLGQIGLTLADYLWRTLRANIVLTSRSPLPPEAEWQALVEDANTPGDLRRRLRQIRQLRAAGADVLCAVADVANAVDMERVFEQAEVQFGKINGVIHAAGLVGEASFATIKECERAECEEQFRPKIAGLAALEQVLSERDIDFCLLCSSLSPILGGLGFSAYAASNLYMDAVAERTAATAIPWLGINWEGWHFEDEPDLGGAGAAVAELGLSPEEGCDVFARLMDVTGLNRIVVSTGALERRIAQWVGGFEVVGDESGVFVAQGGRPSLLGEPVDPSTPTEEAMVDLWRRLLGIEAIGAQDNFFELGGNSLLLTQLVALMRRTFQVDLSLAELFNTPTVADIAAQIERQSGLFTDADREVGEI